MSAESLEALLRRLVDDEEFRRQLESEPTKRAKRRLIFEAGYDIEPEDVGALRDTAGREPFGDRAAPAKHAIVDAFFHGMHVP